MVELLLIAIKDTLPKEILPSKDIMKSSLNTKIYYSIVTK